MSLTIGAHPKYSSSSNNINNSEMLVSDESKKHNHSEIEKRRRDKMNHYITELSCLIPMCNAMSRKLDKLTVLRMAVQHMKTIKGSMNAFAGSGNIRPTFLSDEALLKLISQISEGFLFVVSCDRGRILFVSGSVSQTLNYSQGDLLGQNWFDILHPKDVAKVKEQLSSSDLSPKERLIDAKSHLEQRFILDHQWMDLASHSSQLKAMLPVKSTASPSSQVNMSPGARRSFFCRMKFKSMPRVKEEADTTTGYAQKRRKSQSSDRKYCVVHCIGYLKSWISTKMSVTEESENESDIYNMSCLVAIGRTLPNICGPAPHQPDIPIKPISFTSRHTIDGKFLFVDQRATLILGYLPQELLGTCCYEYCHHEDLKILAESHRLGLEASGESSKSAGYRFKTKSGPYICLQTTWKTFRNPWTKEFEFLIAVNTCVSDIDKVESSVNGENSNNNNNYVTASWKTSSTVDDILFRISDSCKNRAHKSNGNSNSSNTGTNNTTNGNNNLGVGGGASSNEQSSTGYSSTDTRSVQKMLASSRVALWKIGRYIADEVIENQRRYEESNFLLSASPYSSSTIPILNTFVNTDSEFDKLKKWKPDNVARGLIASQIKSSGLIQQEIHHSQLQQQQSQLGPSNPTTSVNTNNSNCNNNSNNSGVNNNVNKNEINSSSSGNDSNIWLDSGSLTTLAGPSAVESDLNLTVSSNQGVTNISTGNCTMETDTSSYGTNGVDTKSSYRHENNYDPLGGGGGGTTNPGVSLPNGINVNGVDPSSNDSTTNGSQNRQNTNCLTSLTCISGEDYYRTSDASLPILPESSNETDETSQMNSIQLIRGHTADDQENEDAAMDLIMSILDDTGLEGPGDPNHPPCPWF